MTSEVSVESSVEVWRIRWLLTYANETLDGDTPSISYATVYPLGMFIRVVIAQVIVMFFV